MSSYKFYLIVFFTFSMLVFNSCSEQTVNQDDTINDFITIDTVISFMPGLGQTTGQSKEYYPQNIYGLPSSKSNENIPENSPYEILSLGLGGKIIVAFKDYSIVDLEGADFIIFENVFKNPINNKMFCEPAKVSVSSDGINYVSFPFDSSSLIGCAGLTPTHRVSNNPLDWGGDKFDLNDLKINKIKYIMIEDISKMILDNPNHFFYDPTISGFDLDAIIGLHYEKN